ncbi:MAG: isoprenyl transferase [Victivallales bacterium]|nr:isoprenyl transferase [Victivallales bacterium]
MVNESQEKQLCHVALIMDGNGRWAQRHGVSRIEGHKQGAIAVQKLIESASEFGIKYITLYAFSTENWKRSREEVNGLMDLLKEFIDNNLEHLQKNGIRLLASGRIEQLPEHSRESLKNAIKLTADNTSGTLILALNYGGRSEICDAAKKFAHDVVKHKIDIDELDESRFRDYLYLSEVPDPDLMIRTSGELRLSNFLLWQLSYAEIYVTDTLWPDFDRDEMKKAIDGYYQRERRFGGRG